MGSDKEQKIVDETIKQFPESFGLRAFPGQRFRLSRSASYFRGPGEAVGLMLYTEVLKENGQWSDFCKGTIEELRRNIVQSN